MAIEKYGTPQTKTEGTDGTVKVAAQALKSCCKPIWDMLLPGQHLTCQCGNRVVREKV